jgi:molybdate transport system substrate-binding protein
MIGRAAFALAFSALLLVAACDSGAAPTPLPTDTPSANPNAGVIRVAASSSLTEVLKDAVPAFESANPGNRVELTFGASPTVAKQAENGGFDVWAGDDQALAQSIVSGQHAAGPAQAFASDRVVLVVPATGAVVTTPADLAKKGIRIAGAAPDTGLATATGEVIDKLAATAASPSTYASAVKANMVSTDEDARDVVGRVANGQADAAFAYASDAKVNPKVKVIPLPDAATVRSKFAAVVMATAGDTIAGSDFTTWLATKSSPQLTDRGFDPPSAP